MASGGAGTGDGGRIRVAVLFGGQSDEHDVSLRSAQTVIGALDPARYEIVPIGITRDGGWLTGGDPMRRLTSQSPLFALGGGPQEAERSQRGDASGESGEIAATAGPGILSGAVDVIFPVLHGPRGEDGTVQGLLELANLPYVGSGVLGSAVAMDKAMAKTVLAEAGIPQGPWELVTRSHWRSSPETVIARIEERLGYPCFVKPANLGSSVGISKAHGPEELPAALDLAAHFDRRIVVERGLDARELEISVLGNETPIASVPGEIVPCNEFYDYSAKYVEDGSELIIPADVPGDAVARIQDLAVRAFVALDLAGLARVDFFLERESGALYLNEVNTIPGFTSISMYPMLWAASGVPIEELVERLIALAMERNQG